MKFFQQERAAMSRRQGAGMNIARKFTKVVDEDPSRTPNDALLAVHNETIRYGTAVMHCRHPGACDPKTVKYLKEEIRAIGTSAGVQLKLTVRSNRITIRGHRVSIGRTK